MQSRTVDRTLHLNIQMAAEDQAEDQDLVQYFDIQGKIKLSNSSNWRYWVVSTRDATSMAGLVNGIYITRVVHSTIKLITRMGQVRYVTRPLLGCTRRPLGGNRPIMGKNQTQFPKVDQQESNDRPRTEERHHTVFDDNYNRFKFFAASGTTKGAEVQFPQLPLLPMEIALKNMRTDTTSWELYQILLEFEVGKNDLVKEYLLPVKNWTMLASIKKGYCRTMEMMVLLAVTFPSRDLKDAKKYMINQTLGPCPTVSNADGLPAAGVKSTNKLLMAMLAVHSANAQRQTEHNPGDLYMRISTGTMRMFQENTPSAMYRQLSDGQKGSIMGWYRVTCWDKVPTIWEKIEDTKTDTNLRRHMQTEWEKGRGNDIDRQLHNFEWTDDLLKSIQTVELSGSSVATFLTLESGISAINFMPVTPEQNLSGISINKYARRHIIL